MWAKWIGIPYKCGGRDIKQGLDCYGLVVEIYKQELGITLPKYDLITPQNYDKCSDSLLRTELYRSCLKKESHQDIEEFDILLFNNRGRPLHIAIAIDDSLMIHSDEYVGSVIESHRSNKWKNRLHQIISLKSSFESTP